MIVRGDVSQFERLVVVASPDVATSDGLLDLEPATQLAAQVIRGAKVAVVTTTPDSLRRLFPAKQVVEWIESGDPVGWLAGNLKKGDVPLFVGTDTAHEAMRQMPALIEGRFLIVHAARPEAHLPEPVTGPVVMGRSLKPRHA